MRRKVLCALFGAAAAVVFSGQVKADLSDFSTFDPVNAVGGGGSYTGSTLFTLTNNGGGEATSGFSHTGKIRAGLRHWAILAARSVMALAMAALR